MLRDVQGLNGHAPRFLGYVRGARVLAMEFVPGGDCAEYVLRERARRALRADAGLPPAVAADLARAMLSPLEALHALGYVHRDVKPSNFMRADRDARAPCGARGLRLIDFGLARRVVDAASGEHVAPRATAPFRGTKLYASLAAHDERDQGRVDDLWSWLYIFVEARARRAREAARARARHAANRSR